MRLGIVVKKLLNQSQESNISFKIDPNCLGLYYANISIKIIVSQKNQLNIPSLLLLKFNLIFILRTFLLIQSYNRIIEHTSTTLCTKYIEVEEKIRERCQDMNAFILVCMEANSHSNTTQIIITSKKKLPICLEGERCQDMNFYA